VTAASTGPARKPGRQLDGLLAIHKPVGMISKDVSRWLTKRVGKLKLGHVGTLDPSAAGVLPILLGRATRLQDFLLDMPKIYEFDMTFGRETDTLDDEGVEVATLPWAHVTAEALAAAAANFVGEFDQIPPLYSAVKYKGKALYDYARAGRGDEVPLADLKRRVQVSSFEMLSYKDGVGTLRLTCSRGTYVRVLVKDIAAKLGSCATLTRLVRMEAAGVTLADSVQLESLEPELDRLETFLVPMGKINLGMPRWRSTNKAWIDRLAGGQQIGLELEDYLAGLDGAGNAGELALPGGWARPLLLTRESGDAFGMGTVKRQESGRVVISMKRGL
jgi:tRNA pseudouridine55 synthase